ncbi:helix-turn-helix domain-containing protein [Lacrimispora sp. 38-1]|uniref:helix-turn-helix domain-containing protein n=1 Tax=Lacrimispora sp. 38-1 TaxID=3125778 RepID=UPI003CF7096D
MKLSEKIQYLRKENGFTQEQLAEKCNVSRQAITKWESDIAIPETGKIIFLSRLFKVSIDELLKDEFDIDGVKEVSCCGKSLEINDKSGLYEGVLIKESITDENVLDLLEIKKVEIWKTGGKTKYWTVLFFLTKHSDFPEEISKVMKTGDTTNENWFVDFKSDDIKYIVFKNLILKYSIGNQEEKRLVCERCRELGIPDNQMQWSE